MAELTKELNRILGIEMRLSIAFHCYGYSDTNNFIFLFFSFISSDFTFLFSLLYFLGKTMKKARDKEVT